MSSVRVELPPKLIPVFAGEAMYRGAYGGRGSAKTRSFAKMAAVWGMKFASANMPGVIVCGREYMNSLEESSLAEVKAAIASEPWLTAAYEVGEKFVRTVDGRIEFAFIGLRHNLDSIKSKARIRLLWVDEADPVSETAWAKAIPTVREDGSEIWVTWNPERRKSATHKRFRLDPPDGSKIVEINWQDNPWFPGTLDRTRLEDQAKRPDQYAHIWDGDFVSIVDGAYYAKALALAKAQGRISNVAADPLMTLRAFWDIGGTGAKADATAIWVAQFIGKEIRVLDYYEAVGQPLATHIQWLRERGWSKALCVLPHDGGNHEKVISVTYESAIQEAGFDTQVIPNQGRAAAKMRVEAGRRLFPACWFNASTTEPGREALGWYHEKKSDDEREVGLGPEHDWSSNGCFLGETEVLTRYGTCQMMNLPNTGEVLTPCGWKPYIAPRVTRLNAPLVEVAFTDGYSVKCTPDHLFLTESGWKSAASLTPNTVIQSTLTRSRNISTGVSIVCGRVTTICRAAARNCIETFGLAHLARSLMGATSIIGTAMCSTTGLKTWNALTLASICPQRGESANAMSCSISARPHVRKPLIGTPRQRGVYGIGAMPSGQRVGRSGSAKSALASIAGRSISRLFAKAETLASIVPRLARSLRTAPAASRTNGRAIIESVRPLNEAADVWDITVPDGHWFSLKNGAVVHNSDAFGLMAIAYEEPLADSDDDDDRSTPRGRSTVTGY